MFLRVSKYQPNVIFFLCNANIKYSTCKRNWLGEVGQYKTAYVELIFARPILFIAFSSFNFNSHKYFPVEDWLVDYYFLCVDSVVCVMYVLI